MKSLSTKLGRRKKKEVVIPICAGDSFGVRDFVTLCTSETHPIYADHIALPETIKGTLGEFSFFFRNFVLSCFCVFVPLVRLCTELTST